MKIKILGSGCKKCKKLYQNSILAASKKGIEIDIVKVTDFLEIAKYNVMQTPALVIDETIMSKGKVLTVDEIVELL